MNTVRNVFYVLILMDSVEGVLKTPIHTRILVSYFYILFIDVFIEAMFNQKLCLPKLGFSTKTRTTEVNG